MTKRRKKHADTSEEHSKDAEPLIGRQPVGPPRKNWTLLMTSIALLAVWIGFLVWLAMQSEG